MLLNSLFHIKENIKKYLYAYHSKVLEYDDEYINEYQECINTDCYGTVRMLIDILSKGDIKIYANLFRIENPFFSGYHDFLVLGEHYDGDWYLVDSWSDSYTMRIVKVDITEFREKMTLLKDMDLLSRQRIFADFFHWVEISDEISTCCIKISYVSLILRYSQFSTIDYVYNAQPPGIEFLGIN